MNWEIIRALVALAMLIGAAVGSYKWVAQHSDYPLKVLIKAVVTLYSLYLYLFHIRAMASGGGQGVVISLLLTVSVAVALASVWVKPVLDLITGPISWLFLGDSGAKPNKPYYAIAKGRRKSGNHEEAVAEIEKQLAKFPGDPEGILLMAEIQAEELIDLEAAAGSVELLLEEDSPDPAMVSLGLNKLADWQIKIGLDPDAARASLSRIGSLFPNTDFANEAATRLKRLPSRDFLVKNARNFRQNDAPKGPKTKTAATVKQVAEPPPADNSGTPSKDSAAS